eukprot:TRINITY_DN18305_c0_g1_i1.p1 TRINITY_DN18305_c0_g1~~TRINITY_DN18305_c0_g1_i1.p1  ORF type:complete len:154 (+),score=38.33 TRINITY_DN18305_c0_g1_i1:40-462(+)
MLLAVCSIVVLSQSEGDWFLMEDCTTAKNITECCNNGTSNYTLCESLVGCMYVNTTGDCVPAPVNAPLHTPQAAPAAAPESSDSGSSGMATGAKVVLFFFTYFLAIGVFYGSIRLARHFGYLKTGSLGEKMRDAKKGMLG